MGITGVTSYPLLERQKLYCKEYHISGYTASRREGLNTFIVKLCVHLSNLYVANYAHVLI